MLYEDFGVARPIDGEVVFDEEFRSPYPSWVNYSPQQPLRVMFCPIDKPGPLHGVTTGTYYLLLQQPHLAPPQCQAMY